ncbi:hypothetical protein BU14_0266s0002 [Porphyra umbilicalis]|uniref:Uncharacterized protein n=1 Tax=Porphyra umbilicalis TaxID=2786 RepID=A0A1X6P1P8_PORUM|nr:hypothetical protein BU14_0266s0002 [Porphyra umbilicalis]|eukprot:OSX74811.1 hypothetical protein BU14_0266s0002 [Porphyra umbilicalis]
MVAVDGHMAPYGAKGKRFAAVAAALNAHPDVPFEVTPKAATDRYELLMEWYRKGDVLRLRRNGSEEDYETVAELLAAVAADLDSASAAKAAAADAGPAGPATGAMSWAPNGQLPSGGGVGPRSLMRAGGGMPGVDEEDPDGIVVTPLMSSRNKRPRLDGGMSGASGMDEPVLAGQLPIGGGAGSAGGGAGSGAGGGALGDPPSPWDHLLRIEKERNAVERQRLEREAARLEVEAGRLRAASIADAARLAAEKEDRAASRQQMTQLMALVSDLAKRRDA